MAQCVAFGCSNRNVKESNESGTSKITFHRFPKDPEKRQKWTAALKRDNFKPSNYSVICSNHFKETDFDNSSPFRRYIRKDAVPTIFPSFPKHLQPSTSKERRVLKRNLPPSSTSVPSKITKTELQRTTDKLKSTILKLTATKKKLRNLNLRHKRSQLKITNLHNIISELDKKRYIEADYCDFLSNISKTSMCLIRRESQKKLNPKLKNLYDDRLRNFAITLNFLSPKAYNYVRDTFQTCLPHPRTISKWYSSLNAEPGFSVEVFRVLKEKCQNQNNLVCSLMFDAMAIRQHVDWDGKKLYGHMDLGCGNRDDGAPLANEVFVIHLVFINSLWKIPLGYFFIKGITGEQIYSLISHCLQLLSNVNIKVASITCDGTSSNLSALVKLGCDFKGNEFITHFNTPAHHINVFLDPPHMLKLVRNAFHDLNELIDPEGRAISWNYLNRLMILQKKEGVHLANKIRNPHLNYINQKMKVKLAAQLLSNSVADALVYCQQNKIEGFEECEGTVQFIRHFNDLFDLLNSKSISGKYLKQAINENNEAAVLSTLEELEKYIRGLKLKSGKPILSSTRKTGFLGFLICIASMRNMYFNLVKNERKLVYIPMYKISQDHLERLFCYIRGRCGKNDNPSAYEFCHIFRKIIVHKQLHESNASSGNAIPLDKIDLLGLGFQNKMDSEDKINLSTPKSNLCALDDLETKEIDEDPLNEYNSIQLGPIFSNLVLDVVEYIAGYISRSLSEKLKCEYCIQALTQQNALNFSSSLISTKNRGGLLQPSYDVTRICILCETIFKRIGFTTNPQKYINSLLSQCMNLNFFVDQDHFEVKGEDNHKYWLLDSIGKLYFKIKINQYVKNTNQAIQSQKIRKKLTKIIHFKGQ